MSKSLATLLLASVFLIAPANAQKNVQGPRSISEDSIEVTIVETQLKIVGPDQTVQDQLTPQLEPPTGIEAQIWFTLGFMLDSCRVKVIERVDSKSEHPSTGSTLHDITFRCHYKASEFRSALRDMLQ